MYKVEQQKRVGVYTTRFIRVRKCRGSHIKCSSQTIFFFKKNINKEKLKKEGGNREEKSRAEKLKQKMQPWK